MSVPEQPAAVVSGPEEVNASEFGFRNVLPRSRDQRNITSDRDAIERARLETRRDGFRRGPDDEYANPLKPNDGSVAYINESERFYRDVAEEERREREARAERRDRVLAERRSETVRAEEERWRKFEEEKERESEKWAAKRENVHLGRSNNNSVPYNPITLSYGDGPEAERLRYMDQSAEYRAALRSKMLYEKANTYNPVTGEDVREIDVPVAKPHPPGTGTA